MRKNLALINIFIKKIYLNKSAKSITTFIRYTISNILKNKKKIRIQRIVKTKFLYYIIKATKSKKLFNSILIIFENTIAFIQVSRNILKRKTTITKYLF